MAPLVRLAPTPSPLFLLHFTGAFSSEEYPAPPFTPAPAPSSACVDSSVEFGDRRLGRTASSRDVRRPSRSSSSSPRMSPATSRTSDVASLDRVARSCSCAAMRRLRSVISRTCAREYLAWGSGSGSGGSGFGVDAAFRTSSPPRKFSTGCR